MHDSIVSARHAYGQRTGVNGPRTIRSLVQRRTRTGRLCEASVMRATRFLNALAASTLAISLVGGCSDESQTSEATTADTTADDDAGGDEILLPDPCTLATVEEIAVLLDRPVVEAKLETFPDASQCTWASTEASAEDDSVFPTVTISSVRVGDDDEGNRQRLDDVIALPSTEQLTVEEFTGVGAYRQCEDNDATSPQACDVFEDLILVYDQFYVSVDMTNYAWPKDYERTEVADIIESVGRSAAPRI